MALQKISRSLLDTGVSDSSDATAITIDSSERVGIGMAPNSGSLNYAMDIQATSGGNALRIKGRSAGGQEGWLVWTDNSNNPEAGIYATSDNLIFANTSSYTERMRIDSSGHIGFGQTPVAFRSNSNEVGIRFGKRGVLYTDTGLTTDVANNTYVTTSSTRAAIEEDIASYYQQYQGNHIFFNAPSVSAGAQQTFTERMRINSSGYVGIGDSSPGTQLHITSNVAGVNSVLTVQNLQNNRESKIQLLDESDGGGLVLDYDNGGNAAYIKNNVNGALSIYLGGTGTANELDDYEEGTWTPTVNDGTISSAGGYYTKIGRVVHVSYFYILTTLGSSGGTVQIGGLPFAAKTAGGSGHQTVGSVLCRYFSKNQIVSYIGDNASYLQYYNNTTTDFDSITFGEIEVSYDNDFSAHGSHTYIV